MGKWFSNEVRASLDCGKPIFRGYNPFMWYKNFFNKCMAWELKRMDEATAFGKRLGKFIFVDVCGMKIPKKSDFKKDNKEAAAPTFGVVAAVASEKGSKAE